MRTLDSRAPVTAKAQQLPQPPWSRTGVTKFPPLLRQSKLAGAPTRGAASRLSRGSFPVSTGGTNPNRFLCSSGDSRVMEVSPACHFAPFLWISARIWVKFSPQASDCIINKTRIANPTSTPFLAVIFPSFPQRKNKTSHESQSNSLAEKTVLIPKIVFKKINKNRYSQFIASLNKQKC